MTKDGVRDIVINRIQEILAEIYYDTTTEVNLDTPLDGEGVLTSLGLIQAVVDIESYFNEKNVTVSLTSEEAISKEHNPFRTVSTLVDFIFNQLQH